MPESTLKYAFAGFFLFLPLFFCFQIHAEEGGDYGALDPKLQRYLFLDQNQNTPAASQRLTPLLESERRVISASEVPFPGGLSSILYVPTALTRMAASWRATKVLSHKTYLVWDPAGKSVFVKPGATLTSYRHKKVLHALLGPEMKSRYAQFVPEFEFPDFKLIIRSTDFITHSQNRVYPLHGIFPDTAKFFADKAGMTLPEWLQNEYVERLGRMTAELNYGYGIFGGWHTQNLLVEVDESSGRIVQFWIRDLQDLAFDAEMCWQGRSRFPNLDLKDLGVRNNLYHRNLFQFETADSNRYPDAADVTADYILDHSIAGITDDFRLGITLKNHFLEIYARETAAITGIEIDDPGPNDSYIGFLRELDAKVRTHFRRPIRTDSVLATFKNAIHAINDSAINLSKRVKRGKLLTLWPFIYAYQDGALWKLQRMRDGSLERIAMKPILDEAEAELFSEKTLGRQSSRTCHKVLKRLKLEPGIVPEK